MLESIIIYVLMTAYNPVPAQTDSTPLVNAYGEPVKACIVATTRDLEKLGLVKGEEIYVPKEKHCRGFFTIADRMHRRKIWQLDLMFYDLQGAKEFGRKNMIVIWLRDNKDYEIRKTVPAGM